MRLSMAATFRGGTDASPHHRWVSWPSQREHRIEEIKVSLEMPPIEPLSPGYGLTPKPQVASALMTNAKLVAHSAPMDQRETRRLANLLIYPHERGISLRSYNLAMGRGRNDGGSTHGEAVEWSTSEPSS